MVFPLEYASISNYQGFGLSQQENLLVSAIILCGTMGEITVAALAGETKM